MHARAHTRAERERERQRLSFQHHGQLIQPFIFSEEGGKTEKGA